MKLQIVELDRIRIKVDVLRTELLAGLTFSKVAQQTSDGVKKERNRQQARKVYDCVATQLGLVSLTPPDVENMAPLIQRLKSELERMGELFELEGDNKTRPRNP